MKRKQQLLLIWFSLPIYSLVQYCLIRERKKIFRDFLYLSLCLKIESIKFMGNSIYIIQLGISNVSWKEYVSDFCINPLEADLSILIMWYYHYEAVNHPRVKNAFTSIRDL